MRSKKFLIISFFIIVFGVFAFYPIKAILLRSGKITMVSGDNWITYRGSSAKGLGRIKDKIYSLETAIDNRTSNYFPFYDLITSGFYNVNISLDSLFSNQVFVKTNVDGENVFFDSENQHFFLTNNLSKNDKNARIENQIAFYNDIAQKYPNVDIYVYLPLRYETTKLNNYYNENEYVEYFIKKLDSKIKVQTLSSATIQEYLNQFYKTDHHMTAYGSFASYKNILSMMGINSSEQYSFVTVKSPYYGSMAKSALSKKVSDTFTDIDAKSVVNTNLNDPKFKPRTIGNKANPFYDYYVGYFNSQYDEVIYTSDTETNRNLLIISDSLAWQMDYLLAKHFSKTYVINMRSGKWQKEDLLLGNYIKENNITDILFLQEAEQQMFDVYNHHLSERVVR